MLDMASIKSKKKKKNELEDKKIINKKKMKSMFCKHLNQLLFWVQLFQKFNKNVLGGKKMKN